MRRRTSRFKLSYLNFVNCRNSNFDLATSKESRWPKAELHCQGNLILYKLLRFEGFPMGLRADKRLAARHDRICRNVQAVNDRHVGADELVKSCYAHMTEAVVRWQS